MPIKRQVAGFNSSKVVAMVVVALAFGFQAQGGAPFRIQRNAQGLIAPFQVTSLPLAEFVLEVGRLLGKPIASGGVWGEDLKGSVTLYLRRPLSEDQLTDLLHRMLMDNNYSIVDAPAGNGWVVVRTREARDLAIPVFDMDKVPDSSRLVTAYRSLKFADSEFVARMMRSFMPAQSRMIPSGRSQLLVTDTGSNIRKLSWLISKMDQPEMAKKQREIASQFSSGPPHSCGEQKIEKLVVEKLEIQEVEGLSSHVPSTGGSRK